MCFPEPEAQADECKWKNWIMSMRIIDTLFNVGEFIVSNYEAISITNWLQDILATYAFGSCIQNCFVHSWQRPTRPKCPAISYKLILLRNCLQSLYLHTWKDCLKCSRLRPAGIRKQSSHVNKHCLVSLYMHALMYQLFTSFNLRVLNDGLISWRDFFHSSPHWENMDMYLTPFW